MRAHPLVLILVVASLVLAACGGSTDAGAGDLPATPASAPADGDAAAGDAAAGGTSMRVLTVDEVVEGDVQNPVHVSGLLIDDGSGWRLCATVLESYPVQCGGPALQVEGVEESGFTFEEAQGVRWTQGATLVGDVEGGTLTVTGSAAAS